MHGAEYSGAVHHPPAGIQPHSHTEVHLKKTAELGTRQLCCDNVTLFSGHKIDAFCIMFIFVVATPFRYRDLNISHICFLVPKALLRCRVVVVAKLQLAIVACPLISNLYSLYLKNRFKKLHNY